MFQTMILLTAAFALPTPDQAPATAPDRPGQDQPGSPPKAAATADNVPASPDVVVRASRPRGSVIGDIPPERVLDQTDIGAYGVDTVDDLIRTLGPQLASGRGRDDDGPVVLLNGRRVSSFAEIARLPTEAIERMEVLPEEVALKYGYRADQKVVNVVVFEHFDSQIGQLAVSAPTEGGQDGENATASLLRLRGDFRANLDLRYGRTSDLREGARDLRQPGGDQALGRVRTLLPSSRRVELTGTLSGPLLKDVPATANAHYDHQAGRSLLGIGATGLLAADTGTGHLHAGGTAAGRAGAWRWNATGNYDRTGTTTLTDTGDPARPRDRARSTDALVGGDLLASGPLLALPAGPASASVKAGADLDRFTSRSRAGNADAWASLSRTRTAIQANIDMPLAGARGVGRLTASADARLERLSDFGSLPTYGGGLSWSPLRRLDLRTSVTDERGAPSLAQLGNPLIVTPGVRIFDPVRGETVDVTQAIGGNRGLRPDHRHVVSLGLAGQPFHDHGFTIGIDYVGTRIDHPIAAFPVLTPAIEAAFPERFTRATDGRLVGVDATPVNFARSDERELRSRISFVHALGAVPPGFEGGGIRYDSADADVREVKPGEFTVVPHPGSVFESNLEQAHSRLFLNIEHTWRLASKALVRSGVAPLDLLRGDALGPTGGRPRHMVEVQAGIAKGGLGASVTADWQGGTSVRGLGTTGALAFAGYATIDLRLFANVGDHLGAKAPRLLRGLRASFMVTNLLDTRPGVRDATGATPIGYQPAYLSPLGRTVALNIRKMF